MQRFHAALTCALALTLAPQAAPAQSSQDIQTAKQLADEGAAHYKAGSFAAAATAFKAAYDLSGRAELLFNVGQSFRLAGDLRQAEAFLQQYLAESPGARNAAEVVNAIVEIQQQIAADLATVHLETPVPGRAVFVDDEPEPRCATPCSVTVASGARRLTLRGEAVADRVHDLELSPGETRRLDTALEPLVRRGWLLVSTDRPAGTLTIGDSIVALPLEEPLELEIGDYDLRVVAARNATWTGRASVVTDQNAEIFVPMQSLVDARRRSSPKRVAAFGLWGVSIGSIAGGVLLGVQARDTHRIAVANDFADARQVDQGRAQQLSANLMFAGAATAALTGIVLYLWNELAAPTDPTP